MSVFSERLKLLIKRENITIPRAAEMIGMTLPSVWAYLGDRTTPRMYAIEQICRAFGVSADWLLGLRDEEINKSGKWIDLKELYYGKAYFKCSECGNTWDVRSKYCAQCGMPMENWDFDGLDIQKVWNTVQKEHNCESCRWYNEGICESALECYKGDDHHNRYEERE